MKCTYIKSNNEQCGANAIRGEDCCFSHNPNYGMEKQMAVTKGGLNRKSAQVYGSKIDINTPDDIKRLMAKAINSLWTGNMPASNPAGSLGYLSKVFLEAHDKSDLEARVEELEKRIERAKI